MCVDSLCLSSLLLIHTPSSLGGTEPGDYSSSARNRAELSCSAERPEPLETVVSQSNLRWHGGGDGGGGGEELEPRARAEEYLALVRASRPRQQNSPSSRLEESWRRASKQPLHFGAVPLFER